MPPWAAIECARRGESWYVKTFTLKPSSPSEAAAAAPARPEPTTMNSNFRRLFGLTSFRSNLWLSHLSASGPAGIFESSVSATAVVLLFLRSVVCGGRGRRASVDDAGQDRDREGHVRDGDDRRERDRELAACAVVAGVVQPHALEHRPGAVEQVDAECDVGDDVEDRDRPALEAADQVVVG